MNYLPPRCPDCKTKMVFITEDMSDQGGPDMHSWFCDNKKCGRILGSYQPGPGESVCVPEPPRDR